MLIKKEKGEKENLKTKVMLAIMLVSMIAIIPMIPTAYAQTYGPIMDGKTDKVIKSPDAALIAMQTGIADFSPDQIRTSDIQKNILLVNPIASIDNFYQN